MRKVFLGILVVQIAIAVCCFGAFSAPPAEGNSEYAPWFHSLKDRQGVSCCDVSDCRHFPTRVGASGYEVLVPTGIWVEVPEDKIIKRFDNPTGEPVTCYSEYRGIMCFIEGLGV